MTAGVQQSAAFPVTLHEWECLLTKALLRVDDGNADPIRSFEITPERLSFFCGQGPDQATDAEAAFRRALLSDGYLTWCLQNGRFLTPDNETPKCMAMLALSLLVDSLLDGDYRGTGEYRAKLRQWLGVDRSFMNLRGIATMWQELVAWLDTRVADGAPFRRLVLPEVPVTWTHIGFTRYLSFPTKRDLRFLERQVLRNPALANDPAGLVRLLDPQVGSAAVSFGLKKAFAEFRVALRSGRASVDHRFWKLVEQAKSVAGAPTASLVDLRMEFDEDGRRHYRLSGDATPQMMPADLGLAAASPLLLASPNLGPAARRGIIFFQSSGLASWTAAGEPPAGSGPFHVAVASRHERLARGAIADFGSSGTWIVTTTAVSSGTVADILARLGIRNARENVRTVGLVDGVHVGNSWLGAQRLLPRLAGAEGAVNVRRTDLGHGVIPKVVEGTLSASEPVEGQFLFSDPAGGWSRRASFVPVAVVHPDLSGAAYTLPVNTEWEPGCGSTPPAAAADELQWDDRAYPYQDVIEGLYASGRSGLGEGDAISVIDRAAGHRSWDLLRTLVEATVLDERLRLRWRGRVFTLGRPRLERVSIGNSTGVVVSGAMPASLEADFRESVNLQDGTCFRRFGADLAPPLTGAIGVDADALASALGWSVTDRLLEPDGTAAERLPQTSVVGESYLIASYWDWNLGRFRIGEVGEGDVKLVRLVHPGGRDHDLYRVIGNQIRTFTSRNIAILDAHRQAGGALFRMDDGWLLRARFEGSLPIEIARALRLRVLANGGIDEAGWRYRPGPRDAMWLARLLPGLIDGLAATEFDAPVGDYRRGRGARRAMWINGGIAA